MSHGRYGWGEFTWSADDGDDSTIIAFHVIYVAVAASPPSVRSGARVDVPSVAVAVAATAPVVTAGAGIHPPAATISVVANAPVTGTGVNLSWDPVSVAVAAVVPGVAAGSRITVPAALDVVVTAPVPDAFAAVRDITTRDSGWGGGDPWSAGAWG